MDRMLYIGMTGAKERLIAQGMNNHNLANASTVGFRADMEQARSMPVFGPGAPSRVYALTENPATDFTPGPLEATGNPLDVALKGEAFIAVEAPDGSEAYTRAGNLRFNELGMLVTGPGFPVLGNGGPIELPPSENVAIGVDGTITVKPTGQASAALAEIDRIKLVQPGYANMEKGEDGLLRLKSGEPAPAEANARIVTGTLERSNVNAVEAMAKMISLSRSFELQTKIMKTAEEIDQASDALMRMG